MKKNIFIYIKKISIILTLLSTVLSSCNKDDELTKGKSASIKITIGIQEGVVGDTDTKSLVSEGTSLTQQGDMFYETTGKVIEKSITRASNLGVGIRFRIIAYNNGNISLANYVNHADFVMNSDGTASLVGSNFSIPSGSNYIFVAYSLGTSSTFTDDPSTTLNISSNLNSDKGLLYWKSGLTTVSDGDNYINILFLRKFALATVIVDVRQMALNIPETNITGTMPNCAQATMNLVDGSISNVTGDLSIPNTWTASDPTGDAANYKRVLTSSQFSVYPTGNSPQVHITKMLEGGFPTSIDFKANAPVTISTLSKLEANKFYSLIIYPKKFMDLNEYVPVQFVDPMEGKNIYFAQGNLIKIGNQYGFNYRPEGYTGRWKGGDYWNNFTWGDPDNPADDPDPLKYLERRKSPVLKTETPGAPSYRDPCSEYLADWNGKSWHLPQALATYAYEMSIFTVNNLYTEWTTRNKTNGRYIGRRTIPLESAKTDLYFPAAGRRKAQSTDMDEVGTTGYYWTMGKENLWGVVDPPYNNYNLKLSSGGVTLPYIMDSDRVGYSIRCVAFETPSSIPTSN